ncbi:STAS domain-containing protein [Niallia sp. 03133]|uniref:STAS domain-containing protein n=1 Tax=Niallia sp. 03133 TaxID=3458060 RepID=UPI004043E14F
MKVEFANYIQTNQEEILSNWLKRMKDQEDEAVVQLSSDKLFLITGQEYLNLFIMHSLNLDETFNDKLVAFIEKAVGLNWPLSFLVKGLQTFEEIIFEAIKNQEVFSGEDPLGYVRDFHNWINPLSNQVIQTYSNIWERTVSVQKIALQELSAPLIPVFDGITIMPLVGTIDTQRAKQIMENLLNGIVKHRSEVVLIDITGVPVVDTMVAHHIIQATNAVRLVGTKSMIVGIRPEIAQTIVNLGINLDQFETKNTLKKGIESALEYTNRKLVELG